MSANRGLVLRLVLIGLVGVIVQITTVSQITLFGVQADLAPLIVMSVGLLAGPMAGLVMGFAVGLFVDLALVQTLGISSLVFIAIGYWSGRLRDLSDPGHGLIPLAAGAGATLTAAVGFSIIQFLLGVEAPVSLLLVREIVLTVIVNTLITLPVFALIRRILRPCLPQDPRHRSRRAYTTGALSPLSRPRSAR